MVEREPIKWNSPGESSIQDDLRDAPQNQATVDEKFKGQPGPSWVVSPTMYKWLTEGEN